MNHNFADLNSVMWTAIELETDQSKLINHYFPIPEQYTSEEAFVRNADILFLFQRLHPVCLNKLAKTCTSTSILCENELSKIKPMLLT